MKKVIILSICLACLSVVAQDRYNNSDYNIFSCKNCPNRYFLATNSGVLNTPFGIRVGFFGKTGAYFGSRFGIGKIYHSDDGTTSRSKLFSFTTGLIKPILIKGDFSLHFFVGAGYGQWWGYRWDNWTKSGVEAEAGFMVSYKRAMLSFGGSVLNGSKTYATGDGTVGLGIRF